MAFKKQEIMALTLVARGLSGKEIEKEMCLSNSSVKRYLQSARRGLGASNTPHAVYLACQMGIIPTGDMQSRYRGLLIRIRGMIFSELGEELGGQ